MTEHKNLIEGIIPGYIPEPIVEGKWKLGAATGFKGEKLSSGDWVAEGHIPPGEWQARKSFDTYNCTGFQYTNSLEILWHRVKGFFRNFSDRSVALFAGTRPPGNDPYTVAEAGRLNGLVDESELPFDDSIDTVDKFYSYDGKESEIRAKGKKFLEEECVPKHDLVSSDTATLKDMLCYSPLGIAVVAWYRDENGLYYSPPGMKPNHATNLVAFKGNNPVIYDSYPDETGSFIKVLREDYPLQYDSRRYWLAPSEQKTRKTLWDILVAAAQWLGLIEKQIKQLPSPTPISTPPNTESQPPATPMPEPTPKISKLDKFCDAIELMEGAKKELNNPGNLRYTPFTATLGAIDKDSRGFCIFPDYATGKGALKQFVKLASEDKLKNYHDCTILSFFHVYAPSADGNNPANYANFVSQKVAQNINDKLKDFI